MIHQRTEAKLKMKLKRNQSASGKTMRKAFSVIIKLDFALPWHNDLAIQCVASKGLSESFKHSLLFR
jgi:hypothetical protein